MENSHREQTIKNNQSSGLFPDIAKSPTHNGNIIDLAKEVAVNEESVQKPKLQN